MKKSIFLAALMLISVGCFAQKKAVSTARNLAQQETPDFDGARAAIKEALVNEETKDKAETWYVAGLIGYKQNEHIWLMGQMGQAVDNAVKGAAVEESIEYWLKADELAMIPTYDKKGNPKYDLKTRKNIADKMVEYFQKQDLAIYASYLAEQDDDLGVANAFKLHCDIPDFECMQDPKIQAKLVKDTTYYQYMSYSLSYFYRAKAYDEALKMAERIAADPEHEVTAYQYYYDLYKLLGQPEVAKAKLAEAVERFPKEPWFIQNMINDLVQAKDTLGAVAYLDKAIANDPSQSQYFHTKATLLSTLRRFDEAFTFFDKAIAMDPQNPEYYLNYAYSYSDKATTMLEGTDNLSQKEYMAIKKQSDEVLKLALPYFEKAHELAPGDMNYARPLRQCYYRLGMQAEYDRLSEEMQNY
jgi:tetratricopeptide (TPR) repeat protein